MNIDKTDIPTPDAMADDEAISALCDKYYHGLKNKDVISKLYFEERVSIAHELVSEAKERGVYLYRREVDAAREHHDAGRSSLVNLASNDYLGFAKHSLIADAAMEAIAEFGAASGSVPMLAGTTSVHKQLEKRLAAFTGYESALTYNSCYAANYGVLTDLLTSCDVAILDTYVHASILDGCAHTNKIFFAHNDVSSFKLALAKASQYKNKLVIVDGVYSMDGDIAPLPGILSIAKENHAWVMVDESHAIGVIGDDAAGTHDYFGMEDRADIISCSLGKALGGIGGFVAGSKQLISFLEVTSRPFIFSTSIPPGIAAQLIRAIDLIRDEPSIHKKLWHNIDHFTSGIRRIGLDLQASTSAIIPLIIPNEAKLLNFCAQLYNNGVLVNPIFFPVVPKRKSRVRISITAALNKSELDFALARIEDAAHRTAILK